MFVCFFFFWRNGLYAGKPSLSRPNNGTRNGFLGWSTRIIFQNENYHSASFVDMAGPSLTFPCPFFCLCLRDVDPTLSPPSPTPPCSTFFSTPFQHFFPYYFFLYVLYFILTKSVWTEKHFQYYLNWTGFIKYWHMGTVGWLCVFPAFKQP